MTLFRKLSASSAMIAMIASSAMPTTANAAQISPAPVEADTSYDLELEQENAHHRRYKRYRNRHRGRIRGGDVVAGIGILAGIAILSSAANSNKKKRRERAREDYEYQRQNQRDYPEQRDNNQSSSALGSSIAACGEAAERSAGGNATVDQIRSANRDKNRDNNGWLVSGTLSNSRSFDCGVTNGQVDFIQLD